MIPFPMRKLLAAAGVALTLGAGLGFAAPASADPWEWEYHRPHHHWEQPGRQRSGCASPASFSAWCAAPGEHGSMRNLCG